MQQNKWLAPGGQQPYTVSQVVLMVAAPMATALGLCGLVWALGLLNGWLDKLLTKLF